MDIVAGAMLRRDVSAEDEQNWNTEFFLLISTYTRRNEAHR